MPRNDYSKYTDYDNYTMLADRELRVLKMENEGMSTSEIASTLNMKLHTVYAYLMRAVQKIEGVFNYAEERRIRNSGAKKRKENPEYRETWNAYAREYHQEYYQNNSEKIKERNEKYREKNIEKYRVYQREYHKGYYRKKHPPAEVKTKKITRTSRDELYLLSNQRAERILEEKASGKSVIEIAKEQGCSKQNIYEILRRYKIRMESNNDSGE